MHLKLSSSPAWKDFKDKLVYTQSNSLHIISIIHGLFCIAATDKYFAPTDIKEIHNKLLEQPVEMPLDLWQTSMTQMQEHKLHAFRAATVGDVDLDFLYCLKWHKQMLRKWPKPGGSHFWLYLAAATSA